jgi:DNA segregation ATPase FtsK/SpoIIIE-like protein
MNMPITTASLKSPNADLCYLRAVYIVLSEWTASVALIQRHQKLGYTQALYLMERMVANGIVGDQFNDDGYRNILWSKQEGNSYLLRCTGL